MNSEFQQQNGNNYGNNNVNPSNQYINQINHANIMSNNGFQSETGTAQGNIPQAKKKCLPNDALWAKLKAQPPPKDPPKQEVKWVTGTSHLYKNKKQQPETDHTGFVPPKPQQHPQYNQKINTQQYG
eukprot:UN07152